MKQNTPAVYLQISTAQGPAECRIFARFVLSKLLAEAQAKGIDAELVTETADKHGILSATLKLEGQKAESLAQTWQGTLQWVCPSPVRSKHPRKNWYIGVFRLPDMPQMYEMPSENGIEFQTCRSGGKGGQHVNKTESAVRATHKESGISVRVESERSQHANKNWRSCYWRKSWRSIMPDKLEVLHRSSTRNSIKLSAAIRKERLSVLLLRRSNLPAG